MDFVVVVHPFSDRGERSGGGRNRVDANIIALGLSRYVPERLAYSPPEIKVSALSWWLVARIFIFL
jgi:hypothetical protein